MRAKLTGGVAQEVEHLFCKCEALSSKTPVPQKKKKDFPDQSKAAIITQINVRPKREEKKGSKECLRTGSCRMSQTM
jgi:hypothetical protein